MRALWLTLLFLAAPARAADDWTTPFPGVRHLHRYGPANVNIHAAVVDLCTPGVSVRTTAFDERAQRTSTFAQSVGAQLAINADFSCRPVDVGPNSPFPPCIGRAAYTTYGVAAHAGAPWPNTLSLDALLAFGADRVQVFDDAEDQPFAPWMQEVVSGHWSLVRDGALLPNDCPIDPRSGLGLSRDRRSLILAVADGRNGWRGLTCLEMGQLLIELGADRGFALDSGGSTTLWMQGPGVLNHPSDGSERVVGNHLAVFASGAGRPPFCDLPPPAVNPAAPLPPVALLGPPGRLATTPSQRLFDTRSAAGSAGLQGLVRDASGRVAAQSGFSFAGFSALGVAADTRAVLLNLTATDAAGDGYATAYPGHLGLPGISTVNYSAGAATGNSAVVALDGSQRLAVHTFQAAQLIGDLQATFGPAGAGFVPSAPRRLLDTRGGPGLEANVPRQIIAPQPGAPRALALDVVATDTAGAGFVTIYPCDEAVPPTSNLNHGAQATVAASVVARLGPAGLCAVSFSDAHLVVDAMGSFVDQGGLDFQPVAPVRLVDTRSPGGAWVGRVARQAPLSLAISGAPGMPADAKAVAVNLTITGAVDDGFASLYPCSAGPTGTSNVNFRVGKTVANAALVSLGTGELCFVSAGRAHVIVDLVGIFTESAAAPLVTASDAGVAAGAFEPPPSSTEPPEGAPLQPGAGDGSGAAQGSCAAAPGEVAAWFGLLAALAVAPRRRRRGAQPHRSA